jgi:putative addiction module component (TIGR02574 family)
MQSKWARVLGLAVIGCKALTGKSHMSSTSDPVFDAALALPAPDRAALAEKLLESLEHRDQHEIDAAWAAEIETRLRAFEDGSMKAIPAEEFLKNIRGK